MKLFDLHSDTLYEAYHRKLSPVTEPCLQAPLGISPFSETRRVSAIWCDKALDDEASWQAYLAILHYTETALSQSSLPDGISLIYAVEDARLLARKLNRLETLAQNGTRVLTLTWQGLSSVGGAWDTGDGLTDFGKAIVQASGELGILLDISHASEKTAREVLSLSERCDTDVIATHSNSFSVLKHKRNLSDYLFDALCERKALVGISMVSYHLAENGNATLDTLLSHIGHFLSRKNGDKTLAIGSDFDGTTTLPESISSLSDLPKLYTAIGKVFGNTLAERIFFENAENYFAKRNV